MCLHLGNSVNQRQESAADSSPIDLRLAVGKWIGILLLSFRIGKENEASESGQSCGATRVHRGRGNQQIEIIENMPGECWTIKEIESLIDQVVGNKKLPELCIPGKERGRCQQPAPEIERSRAARRCFHWKNAETLDNL